MPPKVLKSNILKKRQLTFAAYTHTHIWHGKPKEGNKKFALFLFIIYWQCGIKFSWRLKHSKCIDALDLEEIARMLVDVSRRHHQKTQQIKATLIFTKCVHELFVMGFLSWTVELHSMKQFYEMSKPAIEPAIQQRQHSKRMIWQFLSFQSI